MHQLLKKVEKEVMSGRKKTAMHDLKKAIKKDIVIDKKIEKMDHKKPKKK